MNREEYSFIIEFDEITHEQMTYITDFLYDTGIKYQLLKSDYELKKQETLEQALDEIEKKYCNYYGTTKEQNDNYVLRNVLKEILEIIKKAKEE